MTLPPPPSNPVSGQSEQTAMPASLDEIRSEMTRQKHEQADLWASKFPTPAKPTTLNREPWLSILQGWEMTIYKEYRDQGRELLPPDGVNLESIWIVPWVTVTSEGLVLVEAPEEVIWEALLPSTRLLRLIPLVMNPILGPGEGRTIILRPDGAAERLSTHQALVWGTAAQREGMLCRLMPFPAS